MAEVEVSLPADLLEEVDREAARRGITRDDLVDLALRRELSQPEADALRRGPQLHREAAGVRIARDVEDFHGGARAPLSEVTAALHGGTSDDSRPAG